MPQQTRKDSAQAAGRVSTRVRRRHRKQTEDPDVLRAAASLYAFANGREPLRTCHESNKEPVQGLKGKIDPGFQAGDAVQVRHCGRWSDGVVLRALPFGRYRVKLPSSSAVFPYDKLTAQFNVSKFRASTSGRRRGPTADTKSRYHAIQSSEHRQLVADVRAAMQKRNLNQSQVARLVSVPQPYVSMLLKLQWRGSFQSESWLSMVRAFRAWMASNVPSSQLL